MVVKTKMADISVVSRVRTRRKNMARIARRQLEEAKSPIWRIFEELNNPKRALSKMNADGAIPLGLWPRRITPSSISIILHEILSLIH